jgi:hypothetical protein
MANFAPVKQANDFERCPEGTFQFVISNFYNIGNQMRKDGSIKHQCIILFEINKKMTTGEYAGKRFVLSSYYNFTMSKNAQLRKDIEALDAPMSDEQAATFDLDSLRGLNGSAKVVHNGEFTNIQNISSLMDGVPLIEPELAPDYMPDWLKKKIDGQISVAEEPQKESNQKFSDVPAVKKGQIFNAIQENIKQHSELKPQFDEAWKALGGSTSVISLEDMEGLYWSFGQ